MYIVYLEAEVLLLRVSRFCFIVVQIVEFISVLFKSWVHLDCFYWRLESNV
jgi:hypothetical protein